MKNKILINYWSSLNSVLILLSFIFPVITIVPVISSYILIIVGILGTITYLSIKREIEFWNDGEDEEFRKVKNDIIKELNKRVDGRWAFLINYFINAILLVMIGWNITGVLLLAVSLLSYYIFTEKLKEDKNK